MPRIPALITIQSIAIREHNEYGIWNMSRELARRFIALIFALVVGASGFAHATPTSAGFGMRSGCCIQGCNRSKIPGKMSHGMAQGCSSVNCVGSVSLATPTRPDASILIHYVSVLYGPHILVHSASVDDVPSRPPPKRFALI